MAEVTTGKLKLTRPEIDDNIGQTISELSTNFQKIDAGVTTNSNDIGDVEDDLIAHKADYEQNAIKSDGSVRMLANLGFGSNARGQFMFNGDNNSYLVGGDFPEVSEANAEVRLFRITNTSGLKDFTIFAGDGSSVVAFRIRNGEIDLINGFNTKITTGSGSPEGVVVANAGSLYLNRSGSAGSTLFTKESGSGNTGWKAVQTL